MKNDMQPLDRILTELGLKNSDLVKCSTDQLTHKMVAKARKGRPITLNVQTKILRALNVCQSQKVYSLSDIFNYQKK